MSTPIQRRIERAAESLGIFHIHRARRFQKTYGIGYEAAPLAPSTLPEMKKEYEVAARHGIYTVLDAFSDKTIFRLKEMNYAFRFMHDMMHIHHNLTTSGPDEVLLATMEAEYITQKLGPDEARLHMIDTAGQIIYHQLHGEFPVDQKLFDYLVWMQLDGVVNPSTSAVVKAAHRVACQGRV